MLWGWSYIKNTEEFLKKVQNMEKISQDSTLMTTYVVGLYPNILHNAGLEALKDAFDCKHNKKISTDMLVQMAEFVLTNNYFEFGQKAFHQISGIAIGTRFTPPYVWIFMDKFERELLKTQKLQPFVCLTYIDDKFFIWTHGNEELESFMKEF